MQRRRRRLSLSATDTQEDNPQRTTRFVPQPDAPNKPPVEKLSLATTHAHREGMRKATAHPSKTHIQNDTMYLAGNFQQRNEEGLRRAYESPDATYVDRDTLFVAGANPLDPRDLADDLLIPFGLN